MALVKHGELSVQQIAHIQKDVLVSLNKDTFWDKFCSHTVVPAGQSSVEWRKLNIPDLTQAQVTDLSEGVTPDSLSMTYVKFSVTPVDYGKWIEYTDKSKRYNFDDVVRDAKLILSNDAHQQAEWRKAAQFISGTCTMNLETGTNGFLKSLLKARTILKRNNVKPISGQKFGCILTSEQAAQVLVDYATQITHTSQKEALIDGYLGELGGFILYETTHEKMYKTVTEGSGDSAKTKTVGYCLFIGKSDFGMPVQTVAFGNDSVEVYDNGLGSVPQYADNKLKPDALHQRGSVGYKVMGFAARILADEAIIRAEYTISEDANGKVALAVTSRSHKTGEATSPVTA